MLTASGPEGGAQSVSMEDVVRQIDSDGMDIDRVHAFMSSTRFRQRFRVMGVRIYRVVVGGTGLSAAAEGGSVARALGRSLVPPPRILELRPRDPRRVPLRTGAWAAHRRGSGPRAGISNFWRPSASSSLLDGVEGFL
ncbi:unnamed protein product [Prorocentrum cordatum]|uniref:Uncharacterized protein n=1 Tax=Prorocentrum cordatum TaxID=2364126 RepID=A0ABN9T8A4_9DINO|nr:unnamed protein product [Polarella glacialis]